MLKVIEGLKFERDDKLYSRCSKIHERPALSASKICRRCSLEKESLKLCSSFGNKFERRAIAAWTFFYFRASVEITVNNIAFHRFGTESNFAGSRTPFCARPVSELFVYRNMILAAKVLSNLNY